MDAFEIILILIFILGVGWILYLIFRDPISILSSNLNDKDFKNTSRPKDINFTDFDKYIQVDTDDYGFIKEIIKSFHNDCNPKDYNYSLNSAEFKLSQYDKYTLIKIEKDVDFNSFNILVQYMDNSAPQNRVYRVKGIMINKHNRSDSYFCFVDTAYPLKLIGKTYKNEKMHVDFSSDKADNEKIYFNSNIDYFKNFRFDKFESDLMKLEFEHFTI